MITPRIKYSLNIPKRFGYLSHVNASNKPWKRNYYLHNYNYYCVLIAILLECKNVIIPKFDYETTGWILNR